MTDRSTNGFGLLLSEEQRRKLWDAVGEELEGYLARVEGHPVPQQATREAVREELGGLDLSRPVAADEAARWAARQLERFQLHTAHPAYYGVFNPQASSMSVAADALVAAHNPQLASSASSMFCIEVEDWLVRTFAGYFGLPADGVEGIFTSGATEANYTAVLCALDHALEGWREQGLRGREAWPAIYVTEEAHHSTLRAARVLGLGTAAVRAVAVSADLRLDVSDLRAKVAADRAAGWHPLMVVATLGTTSAGVVDPLAAVAAAARDEGVWFHVDAAWGGAAAMLPEFADLIDGLGAADSVSFDPHKWLSVAMGCGMFMTRHAGLLTDTFGLEPSVYMPDETHAARATEPYRQSLQWSRRFMGLKLLLTLMVAGEEGYRAVLRHQVAMGDYLRRRLREEGWLLLNDTPLPVACFAAGEDRAHVPEVLAAVNAGGRTWITNTVLRFDGKAVLRAGISNFSTREEHLDLLVEELGKARAARG